MDSNESIAKSSVFYQALLPGGVHRLRNQTSIKITGSRNNEEQARGLGVDQLIDIAKKYVDAWDSLNNAESSQILRMHLDDYENSISVIVPEALYAQPFPCMLQCTNPNCRVLDFFQGTKDDEKRLQEMVHPSRIRSIGGRPRIKCRMPGCTGFLRQVPYTSVHRCGHIRALTIPPGMRRTRDLAFEDSGSSMAESKFYDAGNPAGASYHALQDKCRNCESQYEDAAGAAMRASPVRGNEQMFSHNVQYISLSKASGQLIALINQLVGDGITPIGKEGADVARGVLLCLTGKVSAQELVDHANEIRRTGPVPSSEIDDLVADQGGC